MKYKKSIIVFIVGLISTFIVLSCSGGSSSGTPSVADTTVPITMAIPGSGTYGSVQFVTLQANESAIIYYSIDGEEPSVNGTNTLSGSSPITGIEINSDTTLKFFAIDDAGNQEAAKSESYSIDLTAPTITFNSPVPDTFGLLTSGTVTWKSDEEGDYIVELGGTGTPGTGEVLDYGHIAANTSANQEINGSLLSYSAETPLWIYMTDSVGHVGSASLDLTMKPIVELSSGNSLDFLPDGSKAYIASGKTIDVLDTNTSSPTFHTVIDSIPFAYDVSQVVVTPDATRIYAVLPGIDKIVMQEIGKHDVNVTIDAGNYPNGAAVTPDGSRIYYISFDGFVKVLDIDPASASYNLIIYPFIATHPTMLAGKIGIAPNGANAVVNWSGTIAHAVDIIDSNVSSPTYNTVVASPVPVISGSNGSAVFSSDSTFAYITTTYTCRLCKIDLQTYETVNQYNDVLLSTLVISADNSILLGGSMNSTKITLVNATDLTLIHEIDIGFPIAMEAALSPDGERLYVVNQNTVKVMMIPLL